MIISTQPFRSAVEQLRRGTHPVTVARQTDDPVIADTLRQHADSVPAPELSKIATGDYAIHHNGEPTRYTVKKVVHEKGTRAPAWYHATTPWELRLRGKRQSSHNSAKAAAGSLATYLRAVYLTEKVREALEQAEAERRQDVGRWPLEDQVRELRKERDAARETLEVERDTHTRTLTQLHKELAAARAAAKPKARLPRQQPPAAAPSSRPAAPVVWSKELHDLEGRLLLDAEKARVQGDQGARAAYEDASKRLRAARRKAAPAKKTTTKGN
ncbi:hypothetical protein [Streptomyces sp. NPDC018055]|uniref:hypothetical protein n=1 Tax=Streptomyces sp. NPDC018055 TaxID=3365038 RepID=UPI00379495DF